MLRYVTAPSGRRLTGPSGARIIAGEDFAPNDGLLDYSLKAINGGCAFTLKPADSARESWEAIFIHGQWRGNVFLPAVGDAQGSVPATPGVNPNVYFVNVGDQDVEPSAAAVAAAVAAEVTLSNRLLFQWTPGYKLSGVQGDTQLSSIVITGAVRNANVATVTNTRGRLTYTIETAAGVHTVNWWNGPNLVASGSRTGNGTVVCTESNASGLSVVCVLTYTGDVAPGSAWLDVLWPKQYQIHYSRTWTDSSGIPWTDESGIPWTA
jgi:hypothetical protein